MNGMTLLLWFLFGFLLGAFMVYRTFVAGLQRIRMNLRVFKKLVVMLFLQDPDAFFEALKDDPRSNEILREAIDAEETLSDAP